MLFFKHLRQRYSCMIITLVIIIFMSGSAYAGDGLKVLYGQLEGAISPAQVSLIENMAKLAVDDEHDLILLRLDTPGGLTTSMRDIVKIMMNPPVPICIWVGPEGSHAASAGAFMVAAANVSAMAPGTTVGAASPVSSSGDDLPDTMSKKVTNDLASLIKGVARKRARNINWYADSVTKGVSIDAQEAVTLNVIDFIAVSPDDFLEQLGAKGLLLNGEEVKFSKDGYSLVNYEAGLSYSVLSWLLNPQVAYFLLIAGIVGLFFELVSPGAIFPGVVGGFCLVTALYAMSILPTNATGLLLMLLGGVFFILEVFIISYGLLSVAAIISLFVGSLVLFRGGEIQQLPLGTIIGTVLSFAVFVGSVVYLVAKAHSRKSDLGMQGMIGLEGEVIHVQDTKLKVRVRGEIWNAVYADESRLELGSKIKVINAEGLTLTVTRLS
ncbi:membrane-bound serine protease (ClpP class) [Maridesulfovibrio ferrireducens]|uniref:Membrane-bound serine protease (ClpP class) n=1 Tax=Maridesulfovibrio ferrireducens TaxID=246191 RepID=A0A1G9C2W9_9BACT|nr:nodulation protein NfeD [Maridesulfovibrio ferrireducens]SDK46008.1 membrane-bound serine protease (ClpP class) [Maridesulfovibrio ferrireducens]